MNIKDNIIKGIKLIFSNLILIIWIFFNSQTPKIVKKINRIEYVTLFALLNIAIIWFIKLKENIPKINLHTRSQGSYISILKAFIKNLPKPIRQKKKNDPIKRFNKGIIPACQLLIWEKPIIAIIRISSLKIIYLY